jgi:hypothetical protein
MREVEMTSTQVRYVGGICFVLVLLLAFEVTGCQKKREPKAVTLPCSKETVIDTSKGTRPKAIYLCEGDTLTWKPDGHTFKVEFTKESPFVDGDKEFHNGKETSSAKKHDDVLTVYEYVVTVDGHLVNDPQVIGGGGH